MKRNLEEEEEGKEHGGGESASNDNVIKHRKIEIIDYLPSTSTYSSSSSSSSNSQLFTKPFRVLPADKYDGSKFPFFKQPREVGYYSLDKDRGLHHDSRQLKFFLPPPRDEEIAFNLGHGYEAFRRRDDDVKERLDNILKWLLKNKRRFQDEGSQR